MRWREPLDEILGSRAKVRVLRCLFNADGEALSGREVARRVGLSHTGVLGALAELERQDVVWPSSDPTGVRFRLNRTHELVRDGIMPLLALEASALVRLTRYLADAVPEATSIVLFGSVARGEDDAGGDADVLVVVPDGADPEEVADRIGSVEALARFGKLVMPMVYTRAQLAAAHAAGVPMIGNVLREGRLLHGEPLRALLVEGSGRAAG